MSDGHTCPVDGRDFEGSLGSVRSHVAAKSDPEHDWSTLREQLEPAAEGPEPPASDDSGSSSDEPDEQATDPPHGDSKGASKGGEQADDQEDDHDRGGGRRAQLQPFLDRERW